MCFDRVLSPHPHTYLCRLGCGLHRPRLCRRLKSWSAPFFPLLSHHLYHAPSDSMLLSIATVAILGSLVSPGLAHVESRATACSPALSMSESDPYNVLLASNRRFSPLGPSRKYSPLTRVFLSADVVGWEWTKSTIALVRRPLARNRRASPPGLMLRDAGHEHQVDDAAEPLLVYRGRRGKHDDVHHQVSCVCDGANRSRFVLKPKADL
jgi:hypothetical protein